MALLKLKFLARSRLWADVVLPKGDRLFVPTTEALAIGAAVSVEVEAPDLAEPLLLSATVQGVRPFDGQSPAGVFVQVAADGVEKCRALVGATRDESARTTGRGEKRVDCELLARVLSGADRREATVKSLSVHGLTLKTAAALTKDAVVSLAVTLPDGTEALVSAQVMWSRGDLTLAGLHLTSVDAATEKRLADAVAALAARTPEGPATAGSAGTVVVADDDPSILDFTSRVVTKAGHRVVRAERGDVALELIRKERPGLVFLDVLMPGLDGLEVCRAVRADAALATTPVVLLSAMGEQRLAEAAESVGATAWLTKPMRIDSVRALLDAYLGGKNALGG
ncbi:MAG: response regulator [Myxococcota bacterium]|jgi:CheY-like chemotaxis protein/Tfp pilus assembly protein PilZ